MAYQKQQPKPLQPGAGKLWKNKYKTTDPADKMKPDYQGEVIIPGDQLGQTRKVALWHNKYDDGNVQLNIKINDDLKEQAQPQPNQQAASQELTDDDLPF